MTKTSMYGYTLVVLFYRKNVLKVKVFFEELNVEVITEKRSYEVSHFSLSV